MSSAAQLLKRVCRGSQTLSERRQFIVPQTMVPTPYGRFWSVLQEPAAVSEPAR